MDRKELITNLSYLIKNYIPENKHYLFKAHLQMNDIPVKAILADFNELFTGVIEEADGELIRKIYFFYC
ncbi:hypothetical protein QDZ16_005183 [Pluralibacter gergoviae]|uniref:hypothetical protein n=1 Tax=Pluralibacter gergoviae TaxID=61647 RepID=UPI0006505D3C|nr:hypothetical protein [Pluralibacter gergoviae]EKV6250127.1 hypothetical protein [Pluralibacter gergoviae]EKW9969570.1 hypothetical protein [Pluralibacter gergoviae]ELD4303873.1 hypothetical protein [Pluralibacter gergoviae]ELN2737014.1 hypothetical protein [Pluralibacter gergoviae]KMK24966.1 hypothetical protein ABW12_24935 [Pluralibacter gergoviae]